MLGMNLYREAVMLERDPTTKRSIGRVNTDSIAYWDEYLYGVSHYTIGKSSK